MDGRGWEAGSFLVVEVQIHLSQIRRRGWEGHPVQVRHSLHHDRNGSHNPDRPGERSLLLATMHRLNKAECRG